MCFTLSPARSIESVVVYPCVPCSWGADQGRVVVQCVCQDLTTHSQLLLLCPCEVRVEMDHGGRSQTVSRGVDTKRSPEHTPRSLPAMASLRGNFTNEICKRHACIQQPADGRFCIGQVLDGSEQQRHMPAPCRAGAPITSTAPSIMQCN